MWLQLLPLGSRQYLLFWYVAETLPPDIETSLSSSAAAAAADGAAYEPPPAYPANLSLRDRMKLEPEGYEPIHHEGTGVDAEEQTYESHLVPVSEAVKKLGKGGVMADVVLRGWKGIQDRLAMEDAATSDSPEAMAH